MSEHDARGPKSQLNEAGPVIRLADRPVNIQTTSQPAPATPCWFGEVVLIVEYLRKHGLLTTISEGVRFARRRFGHYEMIDFLAVLFGYAISGERTLEAFYQSLQPFAGPFMARVKRPVNAPYPKPKSCPHLFAGWMTSARLATPDANGGKWCARAPPSVRPTRSNGSARLVTGAMGDTGRNCARVSRPFVGI